jgi:signal transduction histidine kinase
MLLRGLPIESSQPLSVLALTRVALAVAALVAAVVTGLPYEGDLALVIGLVALPWAVVTLVLAHRRPAWMPGTALFVGDVATLVAVEAAVPESYGAVRFAALLVVAAYASLEGERRGMLMAALGSGCLIVAAALTSGTAIDGNLLWFYESVFGVVAIATAVVIGRLRTFESASRLRARDLTRRMITTEAETRRRLAKSIHDGPVQELIALDMVLSAAGQAVERGDGERTAALVGEARAAAGRNVEALRDEIVGLGPHAFEEISFGTAVEGCLDVWRRRYGLEPVVTIEPLGLSGETAGDLFRITQEAVVNAGRHARAAAVSISLQEIDGELELRVVDDGDGFGEVDPLAAAEPGHLGLASMRERAELLGGRLEIESSSRGTKVLVRAPLGRRGRPSRLRR